VIFLWQFAICIIWIICCHVNIRYNRKCHAWSKLEIRYLNKPAKVWRIARSTVRRCNKNLSELGRAPPRMLEFRSGRLFNLVYELILTYSRMFFNPLPCHCHFYSGHLAPLRTFTVITSRFILRQCELNIAVLPCHLTTTLWYRMLLLYYILLQWEQWQGTRWNRGRETVPSQKIITSLPR